MEKYQQQDKLIKNKNLPNLLCQTAFHPHWIVFTDIIFTNRHMEEFYHHHLQFLLFF
jgi:hypothetical protein